MKYNDNVGITRKRFAVASFLISAVSQIMTVPETYDSERLRMRISIIFTCIIDENDFIHHIMRNGIVGIFKRFSRVLLE
jgi:hypothetical protein